MRIIPANTLTGWSFGLAEEHRNALSKDLHTEGFLAQPRRHVQLQYKPLAAGVRCVALDIADAASECGRCGDNRSGRRQRHHR